jgi:hypothetical protein
MKMKCNDFDAELNVDCHYILRNFWEYYLEKPDANGIAFGFVMGAENELGYVDLNEIKPYIISKAKPESCEIMPASGWSWVDTSA